jgi:hypothetical protein
VVASSVPAATTVIVAVLDFTVTRPPDPWSSLAVAVIVAAPAATAVTTPAPETVATPVLELFQATEIPETGSPTPKSISTMSALC